MRISRLNVFAHALTVLVICTVVVSQEKAPANENLPKYRNPKLAIEDRVADLLSQSCLQCLRANTDFGGRSVGRNVWGAAD